jgi:hypothetical protein
MIGGLLQEKPLLITTGLQEKSSDIGKDRLNFLPYARALTKFIQSCDTPMTVGLQGDWGTGKTSMLNMLRGDENYERSGLLMATRCLVVNFETWSYSQFNDRKSLPTACLFALTQKLGEALDKADGVDRQKGKEVLSKATSRLKSVIGGIKVGVPGVSLDMKSVMEDAPSDKSLEMIKFKKNFKELVGIWANDPPKTAPEKRRRVVICVDDLDRIEPVIALEMLEAIKNFLDVEGCVFVLAVDYEVVQSGMAKKLGIDIQKSSGKSFFDKIIQLPFNMPKSSYDLKTYLGDLIKATEFPRAEKIPPEFLADITRASVGSNPRSIKRVMNYARLIELIRKENRDQSMTFGTIDSQVLYSMICMQIAWPELFAHFMADPTAETIHDLENWDYLEGIPELKPMFERAPNAEKVKNDISTFFDTLFEALDEDKDGHITDTEFKPVLKVLQMANFTSVEVKMRPRDQFVSDVRANVRSKYKGPQETTRFLDKIFLHSGLYLSTELKYRPAGKRYVTLVHNRRQLGSLVTLKKNPLVIRLNANSEMLKRKVKEILPDQDLGVLENLVTGLGPEDSSLTGYGDTIVRFEYFSLDAAADSRRILNAIITAAMAVLDEGGSPSPRKGPPSPVGA